MVAHALVPVDVLHFIVWFVQAFALNDMLESCALIFSLKLNGIGLHTYFLRSVSINKSSYQTLTTLFALEPIRQFKFKSSLSIHVVKNIGTFEVFWPTQDNASLGNHIILFAQ